MAQKRTTMAYFPWVGLYCPCPNSLNLATTDPVCLAFQSYHLVMDTGNTLGYFIMKYFVTSSYTCTRTFAAYCTLICTLLCVPYVPQGLLNSIVLLGILNGPILQGVPYGLLNSIVLLGVFNGFIITGFSLRLMISIVLLGVLNGFVITGCSTRFADPYSTLRCTQWFLYCRVFHTI